MSAPNAPGPLAGLRVLELASLAPAPFGCMVLSDLGADVVRITRKSTRTRGIEPPSGPLDRGRCSLPMDLKDPDDLARLLDLVAKADVFVEGFRPGVTERLGLGPDELLAVNPGLIYARMTGWGQDGPMADRAGHDINYLALAGALEPIGHAGGRPIPPLNLLGDFGGGGMVMALGILAALFERQRSGRGQVVDAAMVDGANLLMSFVHGLHAQGLWSGPRGTNLLDTGSPFYDTYETADGLFMAVGAVEPEFFAELIEKLELPEAPSQFEIDRWDELRAQLAARFASKTRDEWAAVFADSDACVTPVLSPWEAHEHPHNAARGAFVVHDELRQPAPAPRFSRTTVTNPQPSRDAEAVIATWS